MGSDEWERLRRIRLRQEEKPATLDTIKRPLLLGVVAGGIVGAGIGAGEYFMKMRGKMSSSSASQVLREAGAYALKRGGVCMGFFGVYHSITAGLNYMDVWDELSYEAGAVAAVTCFLPFAAKRFRHHAPVLGLMVAMDFYDRYKVQQRREADRIRAQRIAERHQ